MIEIIYKEEKTEGKENEAAFGIPRNIRQIGLVHKDYRIYMEDYVYTFLGRKAGNEAGQCVLAVLTGEVKWAEGAGYLFARGAILAEETEATPEHIDFGDSLWQKIGEEKEKYFPEQEIVGWFFAGPQLTLSMTEIFTKTHLKHFGGEKVLFMMDPTEREDAFFRYENNLMVRQSGYYIYYEKNPQMQTYIMEKNGELPMEQSSDRAVESFRKIIKSKKEKPKEKEEQTETRGGVSVFSYAATACLAIAALTVGVNYYRNYEEMRLLEKQTGQIEEELAVASSEVTAKEEGEKTQEEEKELESPVWEAGVLVAETELKPGAEPKAEPQEEGASSSAETEVYQEESDVRKARRRLARQERKKEEKQVSEGAAPQIEQETAAGGQESYVIRPGDTLYQISLSKYGNMDLVEEICRLNEMSEDEVIYPGEVILLP